jgi:hypothetical protein
MLDYGRAAFEKVNNKTDYFVHLKSDYKAVGDGIANDTKSFKDAITAAKDVAIKSNLRKGVRLVIPSGIYKVDEHLEIPTFIQLQAVGFVKIESYVANDSTIHITANADDPSFYETVDFQEYQTPKLISGGILISSKLDRTTSKAIGLELGSRSDLGVNRPLARYNISHVMTNNFNIGVQMNKYNHYIGSFEYCQFAKNNINVRFGEEAVSTLVNSGENMTFNRCVFGNAKTGIQWTVDGFDCNFISCSFDFMDKVFHFLRGYKNLNLIGGHIEGVGNNGVANSGVFVSEIPTNDAKATINLNGTVVFCDAKIKQAYGPRMSVNIDGVKWERTNVNIKENDAWFFGDEVDVSLRAYEYQGNRTNISRTLNMIVNSDFSLTDTSASDVNTPIASWTRTAGGMAQSVITQNIPAGSPYTKAIKMTGSSTSTSTYETLETPDFYRVNPADQLLYSVSINTNAISNGTNNIIVSARIGFYDEAGNLLSYSGDYLDNTGIVVNEWCRVGGAGVKVPKGCTKVKVRYMFSRINNAITLYATGFNMQKA